MLLAPAALPSALSAIDPRTEFCAAGMAIETPTPPTMKGASICEYAMPGSAISASHARPAACRLSPATMNGRSPTLSTSAPTIGATVMNVAVHGISRRPAPSAS